MKLARLTALAVLGVVFTSAPATADDNQLRSIGSLGASHIYTTYGYIGVLTDAYVKEVYSAEKVQQLMGELTRIIDANIRNLNKVKQAGLSANDSKSVDEMISIYGMLKTQAQSLSTYAKTKDKSHAEKFESTRKAVWKKIEVLLGLAAKK